MSLESVMARVAERLNAEGVTWGLGASLMLKQYGIVERANDIDLLIAPGDAEQAVAALEQIGAGKRGETSPPYYTLLFYKYQIGDVHVDLMSGYTIGHADGLYEHPFDRSSVTGHALFAGVNVPLSALEDWYVSYQLLPGREARVSAIEDYFQQKGIGHPQLLRQALERPLPADVRARIEALVARVGA